MNRRTFVLLAAGSLVAACAPAPQASAPGKPAAQAPRRLTVAYTTDMLGFDPYGQSESTQYARWLHIYDTLVRRDGTNYRPHVAESWSTPDPRTWVFKLRKDVVFADGSPLAAEDVVYSFTRLKSDPSSQQGSTFANVESFTAPDPTTVEVRTKNPDAAFVTRLNNRVVLSKTHYDKLGKDAGDRQPLGSGPYMLKELVSGQRFVLIRNARYWGPYKSVWDEVVFRPVPEAEPRVTALLNGEVDLIAEVPSQDIERINGAGNVQAISARGNRILFVGFNPIVEPLRKVEVRQALSYAIDRDAIVSGVLQNHAYRLDGPIGPDMISYDENIQPKYQFDPAKARALLAQAGYADGFDVDFYTPVNRYPRDKDTSQAIVNMLGDVGVRARLQTPEWATFQDQYQKGQYAMYLIGRGDVLDPAEYLQQYFQTGITKRLSGYSNPEVDRSLQAANSEFDPPKRFQLLREAQSRIMQDAPADFLLQYQDIYGASKKVSYTPRNDEYIFAWEVNSQ
ncbi:MAG TPA: ABC transporter substrate-binding protein [Chloroflexota bacterium]|nr:ABC transporter substrate-binding protein [Chloroflexota bacterium]